MRQRRNHFYVRDVDDQTIYREVHSQEKGLRFTGRVFDLILEFNEPRNALNYHKRQGEMMLWDLFGETCVVLELRKTENEDT